MRFLGLSTAILSVVGISALSTSIALAAPSNPQLGKINFQVTTTSEPAKTQFLRGVAALHSFWYDEAHEAFRAAIAADPNFVMAYWGEAMAFARLLWHDDDMAAGRAILAKLPPLDKISAHERAYIDAVKLLFGEGDALARRKAMASALERIYAQYPDDDEAAAFYSVTLLSSLNPEEDAQVAPHVRAAAPAFEVMSRNPDHPGAAHYIIHALDSPDLAPLALMAARRYGLIAPASSHARHMPSHIYTRLGLWKEGLASNESAWKTSEDMVASKKLTPDKRDYHALNWMAEINFELGKRSAVEKIMKIFTETADQATLPKMHYLYALQVGSYLERTQDWAAVDNLVAPLVKFAQNLKPEVTSTEGCGKGKLPAGAGEVRPYAGFAIELTALARARAAAGRNDVKATQKFLDESRKAELAFCQYTEASQGRAGADKDRNLRNTIRQAILAIAKKDDRALATNLEKAAAIEDTLSPPEGTAGGWVTREKLGEVYVRLKRPKDAITNFTTSLRYHALRASSLLGKARAEVAAGEFDHAREDYSKLLEVWREADETTPGLDEAKSFVAQHAER